MHRPLHQRLSSLCLMPAVCALFVMAALTHDVHAQSLRVGGLVHDSLSGFPLSGAVVQLVDADGATGGRAVVSDARGRFRFEQLTPGRYRLGFHHARLDTLGIEAPVRSIEVARSADDVLLAVPSAVHIRQAVCGAGTAGRDATLIMGAVYDAHSGAPVPKAAVVVDWYEYELGKRAVTPRRVSRTVTSGDNGWFGVCDVPREGVVQLVARTATDSTDRMELRVVSDALNHHVLYVGTAGAARPLTRLAGVVRRDGSERPLADATVSVPNGPTTRTNARGEFTLDDVPAGTRMVDVRAMGFYPERVVVNATATTPRVEVALRSFRSVLDTVKVLANYQRYTLRQELAQRQRMGIGRFMTERDIARRRPVFLSDMFMTTPGVFLTRGVGAQQNLTMRGIFTDRCLPSLFLNGFALFIADMGSMPFSMSDLDAMVHPDDVLAIEVYAAGQVPPQLAAGMTGCGAISVWTR